MDEQNRLYLGIMKAVEGVELLLNCEISCIYINDCNILVMEYQESWGDYEEVCLPYAGEVSFLWDKNYTKESLKEEFQKYKEDYLKSIDKK